MGAVTERKYAHGRPTPSLTPDRDEGVRPACENNWAPFDVLMETSVGPEFRGALLAAQQMCATCPLMRSCLRENVEAGEQWAKAIVNYRPPTVKRPSCGTTAGADAHYKRREKACEPCLLANRERGKRQRARRAAA